MASKGVKILSVEVGPQMVRLKIKGKPNYWDGGNEEHYVTHYVNKNMQYGEIGSILMAAIKEAEQLS